MKALSTVLAAATLLSLAACGGKAGDILHAAAGGDTKKAEAETAFTSGAWKSGCVSNGVITKIFNTPFKAYETVYNVHIDGTLQRTTTYFDAADCKSDSSLIVDENLRFDMGERTTGDNYKFTFHVASVTAQPVSDAAVADMNTATGYCNINNWTKGTSKDVGPAAGSPTCLGTEALSVNHYGIIQVTGAGDKELYVNEGTLVEATRPTKADTNGVKYTR